jgi:mannose-6-phosphate isomerase-like protein (cupin superfamily)
VIRYGTTKQRPWIEAIPTSRHGFSGRTFSRFQLASGEPGVPNVAEIWASSGHAAAAHAHDSDEVLYVLSGAIEIDGRRLEANDVAFIPAGTAYDARVVSADGSHVLRIELRGAAAGAAEAEYEARTWRGPLTAAGLPDLSERRSFNEERHER